MRTSFATLFLALLMLTAPTAAHALSWPMSMMTMRLDNYTPQHPSLLRISAFGGANAMKAEGQATGFGGGILLGVGRGLVTFEGGLQYLNSSQNLSLHQDEFGNSSKLRAPLDYVGVPLLLKLNYIEDPMAVFSFKAGAMPARLVGKYAEAYETTDENGVPQQVSLPQMDVLALAGISGMAPISDSIGFLVDGTYFYGTQELDEAGTHNQGVLVSIGLTFSI